MVPTLLSLSFPSRVDFQRVNGFQAAACILIGGLYKLAADHILSELIKLSQAGAVYRTFSVDHTRKMSQNSSIYFIFPYFLKAMVSF